MLVTIFAGDKSPGLLDGEAGAARFMEPIALRADGNGNIIVGDSGNQCVRKIDSTGVVSTVAAVGCRIMDLAVGLEGTIFVALAFEILCLGHEGKLIKMDLVGEASFHDDYGEILSLAVLHSGDLVVSTSHSCIYTVTSKGEVSLLAGSERGLLDAPGPEAKLSCPGGMVVDALGHIIVADRDNHRIRKIAPDGTVSTVAGSSRGLTNGSALGGAQFNCPVDVAIDGDGNILIADANNKAIRMLDPQGVVHTVPLDSGHWDQESPTSLFVDSKGALVVCYDRAHFICKAHMTLRPPPQLAVPGPKPLTGALAGLLESGLMADVTFAVGAEEIQGHRALLVSRSQYFATLLTSEFQEALVRRIEVCDTTPAAFRAMLRYLYTDVVVDMEDALAMDVLQLAEKYQITGLYDSVQRQCIRRLSLKTAVWWLIQSHEYHLHDLHKACLRYVVRNYRGIRNAARQSVVLLSTFPELVQEVLLELE